MRRKYVFTALLFSLLLFTLSSCGGAGGGVTTEIDVTMTDFQFQPNQFTIPAGQEITFHSDNNGAVLHNFVIMKLGTSAGGTFDDEDASNVYWQVELPPGASTDTSFTAPTEPGEYQVVCKTEGHIASGMVGKLTVVPAEE
jgi:plastocyanin